MAKSIKFLFIPVTTWGSTICVLLLAVFALCLEAGATRAESESGTGLPLPRFVTVQASEANVRSGPSQRYPIKWILTKSGLPVEIIQEYKNWRKIRDFEGDTGWVHKILLSGRRNAIVTAADFIALLEDPDLQSRTLARLEPGVIVHLLECTKRFCSVKTAGYRGWADRNFLWGIYEDENIR